MAVVTQAVAQAELTAIETAINAGTAAVIEGRTGAAPGPDEAATGTLLFTLTCNASVFSTKTDGAPGAVGTFAAITEDASADASGTLGYLRLLTQSGGTAIAEFSVGTSGADVNFNTLAITATSSVNITSLTWTVRES